MSILISQHQIKDLISTLNSKANLASPNLTGTPTAPTAEATSNDTQIATTAFVNTVVANKIAAADAMIYKGTIGNSSANPTITSLPATHLVGWAYKVITAGQYAGHTCEVGDLVICVTSGNTADNSHWTVVQNNIDGAVIGPASSVTNNIAVFSGTSGKTIIDGGITIADLKAECKNPANLSSAVPVTKGGTGATSAADARTNLGITPANIGAVAVGETVSEATHATTADTLETPVTINGVSFDGSSNVTIPINKELVSFTANDLRWSSNPDSDGFYSLTLTTTKHILDVFIYDSENAIYRSVLCDKAYSDTQIIIYSIDKFTGRILLI